MTDVLRKCSRCHGSFQISVFGLKRNGFRYKTCKRCRSNHVIDNTENLHSNSEIINNPVLRRQPDEHMNSRNKIKTVHEWNQIMDSMIDSDDERDVKKPLTEHEQQSVLTDVMKEFLTTQCMLGMDLESIKPNIDTKTFKDLEE
jgi:E3 ubiquitin-protein ligase DOA10